MDLISKSWVRCKLPWLYYNKHDDVRIILNGLGEEYSGLCGHGVWFERKIRGAPALWVLPNVNCSTDFNDFAIKRNTWASMWRYLVPTSLISPIFIILIWEILCSSSLVALPLLSVAANVVIKMWPSFSLLTPGTLHKYVFLNEENVTNLVNYSLYHHGSENAYMRDKTCYTNLKQNPEEKRNQ